jgi:curved DNA-binding protein
MDYYDVLGVRPGAAALELELAYKGRRAQYHPDRYANADAETLQWATRRMQEVNEAYAALSDPAHRQRYDSQRTGNRSDEAAQSAGASPSDAADADADAIIAWREFIALTALPQLQSAGHRHFFAPAIPPAKLRGALERYGCRYARGEEVVVLVDDTLLGGAERGAIFTDLRVVLNGLRGTYVWDFERIESVSYSDGLVRMNGQEIARFQLQDDSPTHLLFAALDEYLTCVRRALSMVGASTGIVLPASALAQLCSRFMAVGSIGDCWHATVLPDIVPADEMSTRFLLGLPANEQVVANCHSSSVVPTDRFTVTVRGVYAKTGAQRTVLPWARLRHLKVMREFRDGIQCGVVLSDGTRIVCSNARGDGQVFGARLLAALIELVNGQGPI